MRAIRGILTLFALLVVVASASSQTPPTTGPGMIDGGVVLRGQILAARNEVDAQATALAARLTQLTGTSAPTSTPTTAAPASALTTTARAEFERLGSDENEALERLRVVSSQQLAALETGEGLATNATFVSQSLEQLRASGPSEKPPFSFLLLDGVKEELRSAEGRRPLVETAVDTAREALVAADREFSQAEEERRRLRDEAERAKAGQPRVLATERATLATLRSRLSRERQLLRRLELANEERQKATHDLTLTLLRERRAWIEPRSVFRQEDLDTKLQSLDRELLDVRRSLAISRSELAKASSAWLAARRKVETSDTVPLEVRQEERTRQAAIRLHQFVVSYLSWQEEWLQSRQGIWRERFRIHSQPLEPDELERLRRETMLSIEDLDREQRMQVVRVDDVRRELQTLGRRMESSSDAVEKVTWWEQERQRILEKLLAASDDHLENVATTRRAYGKLLDDVTSRQAANWSVLDSMSTVWGYAVTVWRFEITTADDRPVTVGKILTAVLLLFVGYLLAQRASLWLGRQLRERGRLDEGAAAGLESLAFYTLLVSLTLAALHVAAVPLTLFTFIGGALAIGLGFGSQNIINNFISGLIILVERPIRVGDLVDVGGTFGRVSHIGARCTQVHTPTDIDILVPNSSFLESNVVNWTLGDTRVRDSVSVGVAYGSPIEKVRDLLLKAAKGNATVLVDPPPFVLFTDFGASSLDFALHYHIRLTRSMNRLSVQSELRFVIDRLFREGGIAIPFPQRDVHLDPATPLRVQMITNAAPEGGAAKE